MTTEMYILLVVLVIGIDPDLTACLCRRGRHHGNSERFSVGESAADPATAML